MINYVIKLSLYLLAILVLFAVLPDGANHPLPSGISSAIISLWAYFLVLNEILPVDTVMQILFLSLGIKIVLDIIWPLVMKAFNTFTRLTSTQ
jgi:hypothetical protein